MSESHVGSHMGYIGSAFTVTIVERREGSSDQQSTMLEFMKQQATANASAQQSFLTIDAVPVQLPPWSSSPAMETVKETKEAKDKEEI